MTYEYALEKYYRWRADAGPLLVKHNEESGDGILAPDDAQFSWLDSNNMLHLVTVRFNGELVGYHASFIRRHMHHPVLTAYVDAFYLLPEHRRGMVGVKMFKFAVETLKERGVGLIYSGVRVDKNIGPILKRLGFEHTEDLYRKAIS